MLLLQERLSAIEQAVRTRVPISRMIEDVREVHTYCREIKWQEGIARCCYLLGHYSCLGLGFEVSREFYIEGLAIATQLNYLPTIVDIQFGFGVIYYKEGKIDSAFKFVKEAYELAKEYKLWYQITICECRLALINQLFGSDDEALYYFLSALSIAQQHGFLLAEAQIHFSLSEFYLIAENHVQAKQHAEDSLATSILLRAEQESENSQLRLVTVLLETEDYLKADPILSALENKYASSETPRAGSIQICRAKLLKKQSKFSEAVEQVDEALEIFRKLKNLRAAANAEILLAELYLDQNEILKALDQALIALTSSRSISDIYMTMETLRLLYLIHKQNNDLAKALEYLEEYDKTNKKSTEALMQKRIEYSELKLQFEKEHAIAMAEHEETVSLRSELVNKESELRERTRHLITQTELLSHFHDEMKAAVAHSTGTDPAIKQVKEKLKELPLQMDWKKFETEFTAVHPEFARKLHKQFPKLTPTEMKMCSLLRLNLRSQEIARLLNLAERSVETHRFNIRRKLAIEREKGLGEFLNTL